MWHYEKWNFYGNNIRELLMWDKAEQSSTKKLKHK